MKAWTVGSEGVAEQAEPEERDEEKARAELRAELRVAPLVLRPVALRGRVVTGDALSGPRTRCPQIRHAHGHDLVVSTAHPPEVVGEVALRFDAPPPGERFAAPGEPPRPVSRRARRDRCEARTLTSSAALASSVQAVGWVGAPPERRRCCGWSAS